MIQHKLEPTFPKAKKTDMAQKIDETDKYIKRRQEMMCQRAERLKMFRQENMENRNK